MKKKNKSGNKNGNSESTPYNEDREIAELRERISNETVERGVQTLYDPKALFSNMPLSTNTKKGLKLANWNTPTEIQSAVLSHALAGRDILGAAKTGSGKTLAFLIPLVERLFMEKWDPSDGIGALIITPTRELALQIFEVLRQVGVKHGFSAGVVTGGNKDMEGERERIIGMNIIISTPGRLLHHLEQTLGFDVSQVQMLILDEADRLLDMGFSHQLDSIVNYLPSERQTLLFSATQTKSVKDLARLSLRDPEYLAVHDKDAEKTPKQLVQNYIVCDISDKLNVLYSFIKSHLKSKIIVFFSTCSQVRFVYDCFCGMQPGIPITSLHGKIKQEKRTLIYMEFLKRDTACLLATDIASRGLDFPDVDWVIQVDCPEDTAMYIHRVGRTARNNASGRGLLMLMPHEEKAVIPDLTAAGIPISRLSINPKQAVNVTTAAGAITAARPECKQLAKKAFSSYLRSVQLMPTKKYSTDITTLDTDGFATSYGLPFTPPLPVLNASAKPAAKASSSSAADGEADGEETAEGEGIRSEVRKAKNVNRSLDKLKRQIKEAKAEKKRQREMAAAGITEPAATGTSAADSDDDLLNDQQKRTKKRKLTKEERAAQPKATVNKKSTANVEDEEDDDDFLVPKGSSSSNSSNNSASGVAPSSSSSLGSSKSKSGAATASASSGLFTHTASQNTKLNIANITPATVKTRKDKPLKITSDGLSKATIHAGSFGKKKTFGDDDEEGSSTAWDKGEDVSGEAPTSEKLAAAASKFQSLKRKQLSYTNEEDVERDRQRIQSAHRDKRLTDRDARQKETTKGMRGGSTGAVLASGSESDSD